MARSDPEIRVFLHEKTTKSQPGTTMGGQLATSFAHTRHRLNLELRPGPRQVPSSTTRAEKKICTRSTPDLRPSHWAATWQNRPELADFHQESPECKLKARRARRALRCCNATPRTLPPKDQPPTTAPPLQSYNDFSVFDRFFQVLLHYRARNCRAQGAAACSPLGRLGVKPGSRFCRLKLTHAN